MSSSIKGWQGALAGFPRRSTIFLLRSIRRLLVGVLIAVGLLLLLVYVAFLFPYMQRKAGELFCAISEQTVGIRCEMGSLALRFPAAVTIEDFTVYDDANDTIIYAHRCTSSLSFLKRRGRYLGLGYTTLDSGMFQLVADSSGLLNVKSMVAKFKRKNSPPRPGRGFEMSIEKVLFQGLRFRMRRNPDTVTPGRINYKDMDVYNVDGQIDHFYVLRDTVEIRVSRMQAEEKSGFKAEEVDIDMSLCSRHMTFRDCSVRTAHDDVTVPLVRMEYDGFQAMSDFLHNVDMEVELAPSTIRLRTLGYFTRFPWGPGLIVRGAGRFEGKVANFRLRDIWLSVGDNTVFRGEGTMEGLPEITQTLVNFSFKDFKTSVSDISYVVSELTQQPFSLPPTLRNVRQIGYQGSLIGFLNDFVAYGTLRSNIGQVKTDLSLRYDKKGTAFQGRIATKHLAIDRIMQDSTVGRMSLTASVDGILPKRGTPSVRVDGDISHIRLLGSDYHAIELKGHLAPRRYSGSLRVRDTLLKLDFDGLVDLAAEQPIFEFQSTITRADLYGMHLMKEDSLSVLSTEISASMSGKDFDSFEGDVRLFDLRYRNSRGEASLPYANFLARNVLAGKVFTMDSEPLSGTVWGGKKFAPLWASAQRVLSYHLPTFWPGTSLPDREEEEPDSGLPYRAEFRVGSLNPILQLFQPEAVIAPDTYLNAGYDTEGETFDLIFRSDSLRYKNIALANAELRVNRFDTISRLELRVDEGKLSAFTAENMAVNVAVGIDSVHSLVALQSHAIDSSSLRLEFTSNLERKEDGAWRAITRLQPSVLSVLGKTWKFSRARITADSSKISVQNFSLRAGGPRLLAYGDISKRSSDTLHVLLDNVDLNLLDPLVSPHRVEGGIRGDLTISSLLSTPAYTFQLEQKDLAFNGAYIGSSSLRGDWAGSENPFQIDFENHDLKGKTNMRIGMLWDVGKKEFNGQVLLDSLSLSLLHPLTGGAASGEGGISADITLQGTPKMPRAEGRLHFNSAIIYVPYLNENFLTSDTLSFKGYRIRAKNFDIADTKGGHTALTGWLDFEDLKTPICQLHAKAENMHLLNTRLNVPGLFYGRLSSTFEADAHGPLKDLSLTLYAKTEPGTDLTFRLPTQATAKDSRQLRFVQAADSSGIKKPMELISPKLSRFLSLSADFDITDDAVAQIVINQRTGDMLRAQGGGNIHMVLDKDEQMPQIYGEYTIQRGEYTFVLEGILSKKFRIQRGSRIRFSGGPQSAYADIYASYQTRASLDKLFIGAAQDKYKRRIPVECIVHIEGSLQSPRISFDVKVPQADQETQSLIAAAINTEEKVMRQFASLLLLNMFAGGIQTQNQGGPEGETQQDDSEGDANFLLSSFWELLFNQVNSWLAQIENAPSIDLGFNYRPNRREGQPNQDEAEVSVSMQWLDGRLNVDANWDISRNNTSSAVAGDIVVTQQSSLSPNLKYKAFARSNDDLVFSDLSPYTAGAGVVFSQTFDTWKDLWHKFTSIFRRKGKKKDKKKAEGEKEEKDKDGMKAAVVPPETDTTPEEAGPQEEQEEPSEPEDADSGEGEADESATEVEAKD